MVRPVRKSAAIAGRKRKKVKDDFFEDDDDQAVFMGSDDEGKGKEESSEGDEDEEQQETAEEKRLRLAKAYLDNIKRVQTEEGESEDDDAIAERLRQDALDAMGHLRRKIASRLVLPSLPPSANFNLEAAGGRLLRGPTLSVTATALTSDDRTLFAVSKDGSIFKYDIESGARERFGNWDKSKALVDEPTTGTPADWVRSAARQGSRCALLSAVVSSDGRYFAAGGGDKKVHIWDARSGQLLRSFPGHKDAVTALAFREGSHQLFSGSIDRSIKVWSVEDLSYVDTLFGHQAEVLALDALRAERVLSCGADRTCRVWKIAEESQLVFRGHCLTIESAAYITGSEWITGSADGSIQYWRSAKKKPVWSARDAHGVKATLNEDGEVVGAGSVGGGAASWVTAVAVCRGSDLVATGSGDGVVRLWKTPDASGRSLLPLGGVGVRGCVNSLHLARSGRFLVAGVGQEPRMGRWIRDGKARNGVVVYPLELGEVEEEEDGELEDEEELEESEEN